MGKPPTRIGSGDREQSLSDSVNQGLVSARPHAPEIGLQLGERFLNRREIRGVGRQKQQLAAFGFNRLSHPSALMDTQVIHDDDLPTVQAGGEDLLDVELEGHGISCSLQDEGFAHALPRERGHQRRIGPVVARHLPDGSLSSGSVGIQGRHGNMGTRLIHEHQVLAC